MTKKNYQANYTNDGWDNHGGTFVPYSPYGDGMSAALDKIKAPIAKEMVRFEETFRDAMRTPVPLLNTIMGYIVRRKGKQLRPMLVFLSAGMSGNINERTFRGAALVELLHTATLIHDDVVDDSNQRRGLFSLNALWKNKIAVLVGDYLLSRGLLLSVDHEDFDLLKISSNAIKVMSEGELLQLQKSRTLDLEESQYFDIIRMKTASLLASCCAMGAKSGDALPDDVERMRAFGEKIGTAFQIKDDLFDFGYGASGKPTGTDLKEKKLTLPLIYALSKASPGDKKSALRLVKSFDGSRKEVDSLLNFINGHGGIAYAAQMMEQYQKEAFELLNAYPESEYKTSLRALVDYTVARSH